MRIAILLDLDNIQPQLAHLEELCHSWENSVIVDRRAFANTPAVRTNYGSALRDFKYRLEITPGPDPQRQEVDMLLRHTAHELCANSDLRLEAIAVVSNDNDYVQLCYELRAKNIRTLAIGTAQLGQHLRAAADQSALLDDLLRPIYIGIDLGTTNTVMAQANQTIGSKQWVATEINIDVTNEQNSFINSALIPSSVRFTPTPEHPQGYVAEVGGHVRAQSYPFRTSTILAWKHNMGISKNGRPYTHNLTVGSILPEQAASEVLSFCRQALLSRPAGVKGVVITHPASYQPDAIEATRRAAVLAGWQEDEVVLLPEPHAALYDFLHRLERGEATLGGLDVYQPLNFLVYDLGGGTLDVSLHRVQWDSKTERLLVDDLAISSRTYVGGDNVDHLLADYVLNQCDGWSLPNEEREQLYYELLIYAEKFKKAWGTSYTNASNKEAFSYTFRGAFRDGQTPLLLQINTTLMQQILEPLLCPDLNTTQLSTLDPQTAFDQPLFRDRFNTFVTPVLEVLLKARQSSGQIPTIDAVLPNGGMTRFPLVRERLEELFGAARILRDVQPDYAVARGAALYAAGAQGRAAQRVNPTNIYLEVQRGGQRALRLLMAQGQRYPFRTQYTGFRLPPEQGGQLMFNVWVGMGSGLDNNTTLQRTRGVPMAAVHATHVPPDAALDLEIEYTYDERLLLTLMTTQAQPARFALEIASDAIEAERLGSSNLLNLLPKIVRTRTLQIAGSEAAVNFQEWEQLCSRLLGNYQLGEGWRQLSSLEKRMSVASNRVGLVQKLIQQLPTSWIGSNNLRLNSMRQATIALRALCVILQTLPASEPEVERLEGQLKQWTLAQYKRKGDLLNELLSAVGEAPGKLLWHEWEQLLVETFQFYQKNRPTAAPFFLNSLGKCGRPTPQNLNLLRTVVTTEADFRIRDKAAWALARLVSPGQPTGWQADFGEVEKTAQVVLTWLKTGETDTRVLDSLVRCLYQCLAWHLLDKNLNQQTRQAVVNLSLRSFTRVNNLPKFPEIQKAVTQKLTDIPKLLAPQTASAKDLSEIERYLSVDDE